MELELWTEEKVFQLIEAYRARDILWNPQNENFYKKNLKQDAWLEIANIMAITHEKCNNKIISLLSSYRREKLKEKKSKGTGKGASDTYTSRWFAYDALKFSDDRNTPRKRKNTESLQQSNSEIPVNNAHTPTQTKQARKDDNSVISEVMGILQTTANKLGNPGTPDLNKSFAAYIAAKMDSYSPQTRNSVEHSIFEVLMKADRGYYDLSWRQQDNYLGTHQGSYYAAQKTKQDYVDLTGHGSRPATSTGFANRPSTSAPSLHTDQVGRYGYTTTRNEEDDTSSYSTLQDKDGQPLSVESLCSVDDFNDII